MRNIPINIIDVTRMPNRMDLMTQQEVENFRVYINNLSTTLSKQEVHERLVYGLLFLIIIADICLGVMLQHESYIYVAVSLVLNTVIAALSIAGYICYKQRSQTEHEYYHAVLGNAYRDE